MHGIFNFHNSESALKIEAFSVRSSDFTGQGAKEKEETATPCSFCRQGATAF